jgi:HAD superfamily hydrolase (TIGR01490 family)
MISLPIVPQYCGIGNFLLSQRWLVAILPALLIILVYLMALVIFDLDNTLIAGDSDHSWGEFLVVHNLVDQGHYKTMNDKFYADYANGCLDIFKYLEFSLRALVGLSQNKLDKLHRQFMAEMVVPLKLPKAELLIEQHRLAGDRLLVITATNHFIVEPIVKSLGIDELLATNLEIIDGFFTGKIVGTPTYQEGKVERLNDWLKENNEVLDGSYFYSDSINDLPLLLEVDCPIAVDPDDRLREEALRRHWKIISLRD